MRHLENLIGVDIDKELLDLNKHVCMPQTYDYVFKREKKFKMSLYEGDVSKYDDRLTDVEVITMIEL